MGCDIHSFAEKKNKDTGLWEKVNDAFSLDEFDKKYLAKEKGDNPFDWRSYSVFAFLANVRNYDHCIPISEPRGIPEDICEEVRESYDMWSGDAHSASYLMLRELIEFDYDTVFWNRRVTKETSPGCFNGASLAEEGEGEMISYRENLGTWFFYSP